MPDRLLSRAEAAARLNVSPRWLSDHCKKISPCWFKAGNRMLFDEAAIAVVKESMRCPTNSSPPTPPAVKRTTASAAPSSGSILTAALALATAGKRALH